MPNFPKDSAAGAATDIGTWHRAYQAALTTMEVEFKEKDLRMVTIDGLPEHDQCWINACKQYRPLRFGGNLGKCWLYFENSMEASKFASAMYGKTFKGHLMEISASYVEDLEHFDQLILDLQKIATKHKDTLEYIFKLSETRCC